MWPLRATGAIGVVSGLVLAALGGAALAASPAQAVVQTYAYTGGPQIYVVPPDVTSISVTLSGAQGDSPSGGGTGGLGGSVSATISVTPGEVLQVMVGGSGAVGGFNGGGTTGGGGASDIRRPAFSTSSSCAYNLTCTTSQRIIVAGGGGSGAWYSDGQGGTGGGTGGNGGEIPTAGTASGTGATAGGAATSSAGGSAGTGGGSGAGLGTGAVGGFGSGGALGWKPGANGGGGGGGYWGGGGGGSSTYAGAGGGGGGSSWAGGSGVTGASFSDANRSGSGVITIDPPSAITNAAFGYTGAAQTYTVASDVTELAVRVYGGKGSGSGDIVYGILPVTAGATLQINVGGAGVPLTTPVGGGSLVGGQGGWNGGGATFPVTGEFSTGGGGATDIRFSPYTLADRVVVAGGGGGCVTVPCANSWSPGAGGALANGTGGNGAWVWGVQTGQGNGGTLTSGGTNNDSNAPSSVSGLFGVGGSGTASYGYAGGGGGYWGGAAGSAGGGGSSYASVTGPDPTQLGVGNVLGLLGAAFQHTQGNAGDGMAVITAMPIGVTSSASGITQTQSTIAGTVNPKFLASTPTVQYATSSTSVADGLGTSVAITGPGSASVLAGDDVQSVSGNITGLSAGTTYYYRVCAQSVAGNGCGAVDSFTTLPVGFTPPTVGTLAVTSSTATTGSFSAQVTPGTASAMVVFQCSTSPSFSTITSSGTAAESPLSGGSTQSATGSCSSLSASTTYYVRAVVTVSTGGNTYTYVSATDTFTTSAAPSPSPSGGGGAGPAPSATPTPTPSPSATLPPLTPVVPVAAAVPTSAVVLVNGQPQAVTVAPTVRDNGLVITGTDFRMTLEGVGSSGQPLGLTPDGALILENDRFARTSGTGFMADTPVKLFLFSEPVYVGDVLTNGQGSFNGSVQIPVAVPPGRHTLQANGYTPDGAVRSLSLPVVVKADGPEAASTALRTTRASVLFAPLSSRLDTKAKATLRKLAQEVGARARITTVVGYVQKSGSSVNDVQLSTQRARAVSAFLRQEGLRGRLLVRGEGVSDLQGASARRVDVSVRAPRRP